MADYDIGSAGGISVGQATYGSDNMYDFPRDIGATQTVAINSGLGVENPLEPVRDIGAVRVMTVAIEQGPVLIRTVPKLVRT